MKNTVIGALAISIAAILWGLDGVVLTPKLFNLDVALVVFLLHAIPFAIMNVFMFKQYRYIKRFDKKDVLYFSLIGLFGGFLGTFAIVKALFLVNFNHLSIVVLLQKLQPVFAIALAAILLKEKIKKDYIVWASIAIFASYFLAFGFHTPDFNATNNIAQASLWAVLAAFSFGSATVFGKKIVSKYPFYTSNFFRFGFTSIITLVIVSLTGKLVLSSVTQTNWIYFLIIAFTTGSGAIFVYYYGLTRVKAMVATICELFFPVSAVIFDYMINGTILSVVQWISAIIMITAIVHISKNQNNQK